MSSLFSKVPGTVSRFLESSLTMAWPKARVGTCSRRPERGCRSRGKSQVPGLAVPGRGCQQRLREVIDQESLTCRSLALATLPVDSEDGGSFVGAGGGALV